MATIKAIESRSIHQIQSGQVIVDLCSVVKELVENSLDAGATSIDVRFRNQGLESIEVQDNGSGISPEDYETIALKHYTSKLSSYDDLSSLNTFGFRGEALSSLCAVSKLRIITAKESEAPKGTQLDFETSGKLCGTSVAACPVGTTVIVDTLFYNLPVRRKELERSIKREYGKVLGILNAYACISTGVKVTVSNQAVKGKRVVAFSTKANRTARDNIANVYGAKTLSALAEMDLELELVSSKTPLLLKTTRTTQDIEPSKVRIVGHISKPIFGEGRQTPDRQMFFVNSRPCNLPQISKAFNEVYRSYNITQSPFIFANLLMDTSAYDVNVSPDKRTILLHDQVSLLDSLKEKLIELFEQQEQTVPTTQVYQSLAPTKNFAASQHVPTFADHSLDAGGAEQTHSPSSLRLQGEPPLAAPQADPDSDLPSNGTSHRTDRKHTIFYPTDLDPASHVVPISVEHPSELSEQMSFLNETSPNEQARLSSPISRVADARQVDGQDGDDNGITEARKPSPVGESSFANQSSIVQISTDLSARQITSLNHKSKSVTGNHGQKSSHGLRSTQESMIDQNPARLRLRAGQSHDLISALQAFAAPESEEKTHSALNNRIRRRTASEVFIGIAKNRDGSDVEVADLEEDATDEISTVRSETIDDADDTDDAYMDEDERTAKETARIEQMVQQAERSAVSPAQQKRRRNLLSLKTNARKDATFNLVKALKTTSETLRATALAIDTAIQYSSRAVAEAGSTTAELSSSSAEERLTLTVSKSDFLGMRIVGQFNLGFILAVRSPQISEGISSLQNASEDLFIIDQHASDEIFNFHRLASTTVLTPQPLVQPHNLHLTAIEEETIVAHMKGALLKNGFKVTFDDSGEKSVGQRCQLLTLPTSKETVFDLRDLEELLVLLDDAPIAATSDEAISHGNPDNTAGVKQTLQGHRDVPRPSKVRRMLAMRACRSSIMVGRQLTMNGMERVIRNMADIDKPWNCPHGRPTMRHLTSLVNFKSWQERDEWTDFDEDGDEIVGGGAVDWNAYATEMGL